MSAPAAARPPSPGFDWAAIGDRLLDELYRLVSAIPLLLVGVLIVYLAWKFGGWLARRRVLGRLSRRNPLLQDLAASTIRGGVGLVGLVCALQVMNATAIAGALLGTAGVIGVALGFAFKDIIENYVAGVLMSLRQPFRPRDHVRIADNEGLVASMSARATVLVTLDGNHLRVPNALVFKNTTLNFSRNPQRRFEFDLEAAAALDAGGGQRALLSALTAAQGVLADPEPEAFVVAAAPGKFTWRVRGWVDQRSHDLDGVRGEALARSACALAAAVARAQQAPSPAPPSASRPSVPAQVRVERQLRAESARSERAGEGSADLLDAGAPQE